MRLEHASLTVGDDWVAEARHVNTVPSSQENDIAHENLVFKGSSEGTVSLWVLDHSLDTSTNSRDSLQRGSLEFSNFKSAREHTLDEGCVLHDLVRLSDQLKLLHDVEL